MNSIRVGYKTIKGEVTYYLHKLPVGIYNYIDIVDIYIGIVNL